MERNIYKDTKYMNEENGDTHIHEIVNIYEGGKIVGEVFAGKV